MSETDRFPYLDRLLSLYTEERRRFQLTFTLLLIGAFAFFFLIFFPYMTLLGNRADCQAKQAICTKADEKILDKRIQEIATPWGNVPISTAEVVVLFPLLTAAGFTVAGFQLVGLLRLRQAIQRQVQIQNLSLDVTLIAPLLLDPLRPWADMVMGGVTFLSPVMIGVYSINLIAIRFQDLQGELPYVQTHSFHFATYFLSGLMLFISNLYVSLQLWPMLRKRS